MGHTFGGGDTKGQKPWKSASTKVTTQRNPRATYIVRSERSRGIVQRSYAGLAGLGGDISATFEEGGGAR